VGVEQADDQDTRELPLSEFACCALDKPCRSPDWLTETVSSLPHLDSNCSARVAQPSPCGLASLRRVRRRLLFLDWLLRGPYLFVAQCFLRALFVPDV
jgi:hypothetical protein